MRAMVLAAGVGSRLRPLTDEVPKALLEVGGRPMLEIVLGRLKTAGVERAIVNVHHHADRVAEFARGKGRELGLAVEVSDEKDELLDTGGGLKKAAWFFDGGEPFLLHNVDVLSDIDLVALVAAHRRSGALATLAVQKREASRYLLFEPDGRLCGWQSDKGTGWAKAPVADAQGLGFTGIHAVSTAIFPKMTETGVFSITRAYLRLAGEGAIILAFRADGAYWQDIGSPAALEEARRRASSSA